MAEQDSKSPALDSIRAEIDALDRSMLAMLEQRFALTAQVAATKQSRQVFRAGREADLLRRLIAGSSLDALLVETIWRQIIAFSLDGQKKLVIALTGEAEIATTARFRFGAVAQYDGYTAAAEVIAAVAAGKADIGILPHWQDNPWWQDLAARQNDGASVYIAAVTPFAATDALTRVALIAPYLPDPSESDLTLSHDGIGVQETSGYAPSTPNLLGIVQQP